MAMLPERVCQARKPQKLQTPCAPALGASSRCATSASFRAILCYPSRVQHAPSPGKAFMSLLRDLLGQVGRTVTAYVGDKALMLAAVSAAANVIVADGEVAGPEFDAALHGLSADPVLMKGYDALMLETELYEGIARARTRLGRAENLRNVTAIAVRPDSQRENVFLIAADVADQDGISNIEASALGEIAAALQVDGIGLLRASPVRRPPA
jgi:tellurite resistance protein